MANYMSVKQAAEKEAQAAFAAEMQQDNLRKEEETYHLQISLKTAELALAQEEAERIQLLAQTYQRRTPSGSLRRKLAREQTITTCPQGEASDPSLGCLQILPQVFQAHLCKREVQKGQQKSKQH